MNIREPATLDGGRSCSANSLFTNAGAAGRRALFIAGAAALAAGVLAIFWPLLDSGFLNYDDGIYITENERVRAGITPDNVAWAFKTSYFGFYYPLTWLSHMLDCSLYGPWAGGHHLTSIIIHILSTLVILYAFFRMTGDLGKSWLLSFLFAFHPMHVESVAWLAERKDVLCCFFFFLALPVYYRYTLRPSAGRYMVAFFLVLLALAAKPMVVTAPVLFLLLDIWPLGRIKGLSAAQRESPSDSLGDHPPEQGTVESCAQAAKPRQYGITSLIAEKVPLLLLSVIFTAATVILQGEIGAVSSFQGLPLTMRAINALSSYGLYIGKLFAPLGLCVFYPYQVSGSLIWHAVLGGTLLLGFSLASLAAVRKFPLVTFGWFWFAVSLLPVIGIIQVGAQSYADRYTYLSYLGLFTLLIWGLPQAVKRNKFLARVLLVATTAWFVLLVILCHSQVKTWKNDLTVWQQASKVTPKNFTSLSKMGEVCLDLKRYDEAELYFKEAQRLSPTTPETYLHLGSILLEKGDISSARAETSKAVALKPTFSAAWNNLGFICSRGGDLACAEAAYRKALEIKPGAWSIRDRLGLILISLNREREALAEFELAVSGAPNQAFPHYCLGLGLERLGRDGQAIGEYRRALELMPDMPEALNALAAILVSTKPGDSSSLESAIKYAERACLLTSNGNPKYLETFFNALLLSGDTARAREIGRLAASAADRTGSKEIETRVLERIPDS